MTEYGYRQTGPGEWVQVVTERRRVTCPECGRPDTAVTKSGKLASHNDKSKKKSWLAAGERCAAAGRKLDD